MSRADLPRDVDTAHALEQLVGMSLSQHSMESLLRAVAHLSKKVMPAKAETSVSLTGSRQSVTVISTGQLARDLDEAQYTNGSGPCLHAATTGELTEVADTRTEARWTDYMERAVEHGNLSSLSVPLIIDDDVSGALTIYARQAEAFDDDARSAATGFTPYVAVALRTMHDSQAAGDMARGLEATMESRAMIDQATGILMERHELTAGQAQQMLFQVSGRINTALREVAGQLVDTGELPGPSRR